MVYVWYANGMAQQDLSDDDAREIANLIYLELQSRGYDVERGVVPVRNREVHEALTTALEEV